jgi:thiamine-monophosphate kinase
MDDGTGERPGDAVHALHLGHHELAELVDIACLGADDDVVRTGDVLGHGDALDVGDLGGDSGCLADLRLDEDVGLDGHDDSLFQVGSPIRLHADGIGQGSEADISVSDEGEFGLIARIRARLPQHDGVLVGPGDDAAVVAAPDGRVVVTTDVLVEHQHFRRDWSSGYDVGRKAAAQGLADVYAMGAEATALVVGLGVPADVELAWVDQLADGLRDESARVGASVVGGDVVGTEAIVVSVTVLGDLHARSPVCRSGAKVGDAVVVAGRLGYAAAGLALLASGDLTAPLTDAHRRPQVPYAAALRLASAGATAMTDVSDGLVSDLGHIATASGVRIELASDDLPLPGELVDVGLSLGADPRGWVAGGGDDHAFAATLPDEAVLRAMALLADLPEAVPFTQVGRVVAGAGVVFVDETPSGAGGHEHFRT